MAWSQRQHRSREQLLVSRSPHHRWQKRSQPHAPRLVEQSRPTITTTPPLPQSKQKPKPSQQDLRRRLLRHRSRAEFATDKVNHLAAVVMDVFRSRNDLHNGDWFFSYVSRRSTATLHQESPPSPQNHLKKRGGEISAREPPTALREEHHPTTTGVPRQSPRQPTTNHISDDAPHNGNQQQSRRPPGRPHRWEDDRPLYLIRPLARPQYRYTWQTNEVALDLIQTPFQALQPLLTQTVARARTQA